MKTKKRLVLGITVGLVAASSPLAVGCSSETTGSGTGGGAGVGATAGAPTGGMSTGGSGAGMPGTGGSPTGGTSGSATGGVSGTGTGGSPVGGAGAGGAGSGGVTGGAGQGGAPVGGAGSGGMPGGAGGRGGAAGGGAGGGGGAPGGFTLTSPDHMNGAMFAPQYTCALEGFSGSILPELNWSGAPSGTMSFAITFIDRTLAPTSMNGYHWVIWNIPANVMSLPEGFTNQMSIMAQENRDFLGPCPNFSAGSNVTDTYEFTIYALAQASISPTGNMTAIVQNAETMLEAMNLAKAKLSGTSNARPPMM